VVRVGARDGVGDRDTDGVGTAGRSRVLDGDGVGEGVAAT
jgi:hypothetical protein